MKQHTAVRETYIFDSICGDCGQCYSYCPAKINIPEILKLYGRCKDGKELIERLRTLTDSTGQPIDCIECGACSAHCPQKIQIMQIIRELAMRQASFHPAAHSRK